MTYHLCYVCTKFDLSFFFSFNESIKSEINAPTPVHSSTPGKAELEPRPRLVQSAAVQAVPKVANQRPLSDVTLSQSSTYVSSTDASISPGQLINSFGEFKISDQIRKKINRQSNSLSEGNL